MRQAGKGGGKQTPKAVNKAGSKQGMPKPRAAKPGEKAKASRPVASKGAPVRQEKPQAGQRPARVQKQKATPVPSRGTAQKPKAAKPAATTGTSTPTPTSAPSSPYMDMLNQMRSQATAAQSATRPL
jgi:hypothetical protein